MKLYYSYLNFLDIEEVVKIGKMKNDFGEYLLTFSNTPLKDINNYLNNCLLIALKNPDTLYKIFDRIGLFYSKKEKQSNDSIVLTAVSSPHEKNKYTRITMNNVEDYYKSGGIDGIIITPKIFEMITKLSAMTSAFSRFFDIEEQEGRRCEDSIIYNIKLWHVFDDMNSILKIIKDPTSIEVPNEPIQIDKLSIKKMPFFKTIELKQYFIDILNGTNTFDESVLDKYKDYIFINNEPLSATAMLGVGWYTLMYQILFLAIDFSYGERKKKNQFLTELEETFQHGSENELRQI